MQEGNHKCLLEHHKDMWLVHSQWYSADQWIAELGCLVEFPEKFMEKNHSPSIRDVRKVVWKMHSMTNLETLLVALQCLSVLPSHSICLSNLHQYNAPPRLIKVLTIEKSTVRTDDEGMLIWQTDHDDPLHFAIKWLCVWMVLASLHPHLIYQAGLRDSAPRLFTSKTSITKKKQLLQSLIWITWRGGDRRSLFLWRSFILMFTLKRIIWIMRRAKGGTSWDSQAE